LESLEACSAIARGESRPGHLQAKQGHITPITGGWPRSGAFSQLSAAPTSSASPLQVGRSGTPSAWLLGLFLGVETQRPIRARPSGVIRQAIHKQPRRCLTRPACSTHPRRRIHARRSSLWPGYPFGRYGPRPKAVDASIGALALERPIRRLVLRSRRSSRWRLRSKRYSRSAIRGIRRAKRGLP
jgi:hypothetical protein